MNLATPILICDQSESFRGLLRDMLTKHGFFHVVEAASREESLQYLQTQNNFFSIIRDEFLNEEMIQLIVKNNCYVILAQPERPQTTTLAARLGVLHFMSFPFSSQKLLEKITQIL